MWKNKILKKDAKFHLKGSFTMGMLLLLILASINFLASYIMGNFTGFSLYNEMLYFLRRISGNYEFLNDEQIFVMGLAFFSKFVKYSFVLSAVTSVLGVFLTQPLEISVKNWFVRNREVSDAPSLGMTFRHFGTNYKELFIGNLWKQLWTIIWSLPSLIASLAATIAFIDLGNQAIYRNGVIEITVLHASILLVSVIVNFINAFFIINRRIAYSMQDYILADNPKFGFKESLNLSKKMMKNNKWHTIGLGLSFIAWIILAALLTPITLGISNLILNVYIKQTFAELYGSLRNNAVNKNYVTPEELGYVKQEDEDSRTVFSFSVETSEQNGRNGVSQNFNLNPYDPDWKNPYAKTGSENSSNVQGKKIDIDQDLDDSDNSKE